MAIIWEYNFSSATNNLNSSTFDGPTGWTQYMRDDSQPVEVSGVSHYGSEITAPGRGSGNSLKMWRAGTNYLNYTGGLVRSFSTAYSNFYVRWYMKIPSAMQFASGTEYVKLWRAGTSSGGDPLVNINGGWQSGTLQIYVQGLSAWVTLLSNAQLSAIMDGEWHCLEVQLGLDNTTLKFWCDGTQTYSNESINWGTNTDATLSGYFQHFGFGNCGSTTQWQATWQATEFDALVIADEYVGIKKGNILSVSQDSVSKFCGVKIYSIYEINGY